MKKVFIIIIILIVSACAKKTSSPIDEKKSYFESVHSSVESGTTGSVAKAIIDGKFKTNVLNLKDGDYEGVTPEDDFKYVHRIKFSVKNGKIINVDYNEVHGDNKDGKKENKAYWSSMNVDLSKAYKHYENQLIEKQDTKNLDSFTGATYSLYRFKIAFAYALEPDLKK